jgi:acid phosphatase family membrane protein YuiD
LETLYSIISNKIFIAGLFSYISSQTIKITIGIIKTRRFSLWDLIFVQGGFPSSHSATVVSVTSSILLLEGPTTTFMLALLITFIILIDATGVRWETGKQSRLLNEIIRNNDLVIKEFKGKFVENIGHTPLQIFGGSIVGVIVAVVIHKIF